MNGKMKPLNDIIKTEYFILNCFFKKIQNNNCKRCFNSLIVDIQKSNDEFR